MFRALFFRQSNCSSSSQSGNIIFLHLQWCSWNLNRRTHESFYKRNTIKRRMLLTLRVEWLSRSNVSYIFACYKKQFCSSQYHFRIGLKSFISFLHFVTFTVVILSSLTCTLSPVNSLYHYSCRKAINE